jgi:hypothetical protein
VGDAIESALGQNWHDIQIIVVDDGSNDRSRQVISGYGSRVCCIFQSQHGGSAARNKGLAAASGEFIQFLDADDVLTEDSVRRRVEAFDSGRADAVFGDLEFVDSRLERVISKTSHTGWPGTEPVAHLIENNIHTEGPLHRRSHLFEIGGFDEGLPCSQEFDLHIRLLLHGARFRYLNEVVARAREHPGPSRIGNTPWYLDDPDLHLRIVDHHHRLIAGVDERLVSPAVLRGFALKLWSRGVIAGRNGAYGVARIYFRRAKTYASPLRPEGSATFRLLHALLGPFAATWLLHQKQRASVFLRARRH